MIFISNFIHAYFFCIAPLSIFNFKISNKQHIIFTLIYGFAVHYSRRICEILQVPIGLHTLILIILSVILFTFICKIDIKKSILCTLLVFIVLILWDVIAVLPIMKFFDLSISDYEQIVFYRTIFMLIGIVPLVIMVLIGKNVSNRKLNINNRM